MLRHGQKGFGGFFESAKEWQFRDAGGRLRQRRAGGGPQRGDRAPARKAAGLRQGLPCLPKAGALRHPRRCRGNCRQDARRRCSGVATPVYYSVCGQLKTMLDRANPLFGSDYAFTEVYLLAAASEGGRSTFEGTEKAVRGWVDCFPRRALAGTVFAGGVSGVGEIARHPALEQARRMGMEI